MAFQLNNVKFAMLQANSENKNCTLYVFFFKCSFISGSEKKDSLCGVEIEFATSAAYLNHECLSMVLQRRLDYGVNGYHFPLFPHVPIPPKGKRSARKRNVESCMRPFNLLAAVAGKLLERESSSGTSDVPGSSVSDSKQGIFSEQKTFNEEFPVKDGHSKACTATCSNFILGQGNSSWKEHSLTSKLSGTLSVSFCSGLANKDVLGERLPSLSGKIDNEKNIAEICKKTHSLEHRVQETRMDGNPSGCYNKDDFVESDANLPLIRSGSNMEARISMDNVPFTSSFPHSLNGLELPVLSDDDENSSRCIRPCTTSNKASRPHLVEHRFRKLWKNRFWRVDMGAKKYIELSKNEDEDLKHYFQNRKFSYTGRRTRRISFKRRKLLNGCTASASHKGFYQANVLNLFKENEILEGSSTSATSHGVNGICSTMTEQISSREAEDFNVKLSIKSFVVPELFIEIPETATVGSLKRTVMEAITAIIGSGLHVGVLLQGKNIRDDDRTLIQAGISHTNESDELSFILEPNSSFPFSTFSKSVKPHFFLPCDSTEPHSRPPAEPPFDKGKSDSSSCHAFPSTIICHESNFNSVHSLLNVPVLDKIASCQALAASPAPSVSSLSVVPVHLPRRPELMQRRIRRPFTVSEVEALVQAVEKLGTGRWRDVKIQSFDNAKHRTYVDLKDKWKTLVHTAKITPQQRRGEPVPQELLDRVLRAHALWSQQQAKTPSDEACLGL